MLGETGAAAVMVERGTYGDPWVFANARRSLAGQDVVRPTVAQRLAALELHVRLLDATGAHLARARSLAGLVSAWDAKTPPAGETALSDVGRSTSTSP